MRYQAKVDGEWFELPRGWSKLGCCDCKLTHAVEVSVRRGRVMMRAIRDTRATEGRRKRGLSLTLREALRAKEER